MGNKQHIEILYQGVPAWNAWRGRNESIRPDLSTVELCELDLSHADLSNVNLSRANLRNSNLTNATLKGTNLFKSTFKNAILKHADLRNSSCIDVLGLGIKEGTHLTIGMLPIVGNLSAMAQHADRLNKKYLLSKKIETKSSFKFLDGISSLIDNIISYADFSQANLSDADLSEAFLAKANFTNADLKGANFKNSNLTNAIFNGANLHKADLRRSDLSGADLNHSCLNYAKLRDSIISSETLLDHKWQVVYAILSYCPYDSTNNFSEADLSEIELSEVDLRGINLYKANLYSTNLSNAHLNGADLTNANLGQSNLSGVDLSNANLSETNLVGANLQNASLLGAKLEKSTLTGSYIKDWNINSETCLNTVQCEYVYQKYAEVDGKLQFTDRLPRNLNATFKLGEFEALIRKTIDTIDLIFIDGIDWQAFSQSLQALRTQYQDNEIAIQAIERKGKGSFVVRLETSADSSKKEEIETSAKELYAGKLRLLNEQVEFYKTELTVNREAQLRADSRLDNIVEKLAIMAESQQRPNISINIKDSNVAGFNTGDGEVNVSQVAQAIATNLPDITQLLEKLKTGVQNLPDNKQESIEVHLDDLVGDIADKKKRTPKRIGTRLIAIWGILCVIAAGTAGVADFSNNILELSEKLNVPIPIELIQQNPHILLSD